MRKKNYKKVKYLPSGWGGQWSGAGTLEKKNTGNCPKRHDKPLESYYNRDERILILESWTQWVQSLRRGDSHGFV